MDSSTLSAAENAVFQILMKHAGYQFTAEALMKRSGITSVASFRNCINALRTKLKGTNITIISSRNAGYHLEKKD